MDTVHEENTSSPSNSPVFYRRDSLHPPIPQINITNEVGIQRRTSDFDHDVVDSASSSRRPSAIIAALRRPSQAVALSAAHAVMNQRRYLMGLLHANSERSIEEKGEIDMREKKRKQLNRRLGDDALTTILSALYAKLLVVLGMAFPITEIISNDVRPFFYQGFYLYLYLGSISFVGYMYASFIREKAVTSIIRSYSQTGRKESILANKEKPEKYGSFYLRLGAIAFGIGSMVYSGLEFGRYFELKNNEDCYSNVLQAFTPATRMLLTLVQVQFLFLNSKNLDMNRHRTISKFGLMHMIAANLCEWLYVLVEETKHEIIHLGEHSLDHNTTNSTFIAKFCQEGQVMGSLVSNASPFLFPCTIEYSLICAVILYEMWKHIKTLEDDAEKEKDKSPGHLKEGNATTTYHFNPFGGKLVNSDHQFSVDCSNAHRGLFAGIMVIVLTIISLIMFFVLANDPSGSEEDKLELKGMAELEVNIVELVLYIITTVAVIAAMIQMRALKYDRKIGAEGPEGIGLDATLLVVAQTGMFIYCMFSIIGCHFTVGQGTSIGILTEIFSFIQTCLQTMFVLDGWWRRCRSIEQAKNKPGREIITFLIVANMAMWTINTMEKNRAEFRPTHLVFFGDWAWTIITHISMPLAIFYRFHSTICLFEIWKAAYKIKSKYKNVMFPFI